MFGRIILGWAQAAGGGSAGSCPLCPNPSEQPQQAAEGCKDALVGWWGQLTSAERLAAEMRHMCPNYAGLNVKSKLDNSVSAGPPGTAAVAEEESQEFQPMTDTQCVELLEWCAKLSDDDCAEAFRRARAAPTAAAQLRFLEAACASSYSTAVLLKHTTTTTTTTVSAGPPPEHDDSEAVAVTSHTRDAAAGSGDDEEFRDLEDLARQQLLTESGYGAEEEEIDLDEISESRPQAQQKPPDTTQQAHVWTHGTSGSLPSALDAFASVTSWLAHRTHVTVLLDLDGTLVPLDLDSHKERGVVPLVVPAATRALLYHLSSVFTVGVMSERPVDEVARALAFPHEGDNNTEPGSGVHFLAGSNGLELLPLPGRKPRAPQAVFSNADASQKYVAPDEDESGEVHDEVNDAKSPARHLKPKVSHGSPLSSAPVQPVPPRMLHPLAAEHAPLFKELKWRLEDELAGFPAAVIEHRFCMVITHRLRLGLLCGDNAADD